MSLAPVESNAWVVLDRIICATVHFIDTISDLDIRKNEKTITVTLAEYAVSCGYSKSVHRDIFLHSKKKVSRCEAELSIVFENDHYNDIDRFEVYCKRFGMMMRVYFQGCNITPKMHALESHAPLQMRMFGCLGDKMEAAIERLHQVCNKANRLYAAITSWQRRHLARLVRVSRGDAAGVDEAIEEKIVGTKRKYSQASNLRRGNKLIASSAALRQKLIIASNLCNDFATTYNHE